MPAKPLLMRILLLVMAVGVLAVGATAAADQSATEAYEDPDRATGSATTKSYYVSGHHGHWLAGLPACPRACTSSPQPAVSTC